MTAKQHYSDGTRLCCGFSPNGIWILQTKVRVCFSFWWQSSFNIHLDWPALWNEVSVVFFSHRSDNTTKYKLKERNFGILHMRCKLMALITTILLYTVCKETNRWIDINQDVAFATDCFFVPNQVLFLYWDKNGELRMHLVCFP